MPEVAQRETPIGLPAPSPAHNDGAGRDSWTGRPRWALLSAGAVAVALASALSVATGVPSWSSPYAFASVIPVLVSDVWLSLDRLENFRRVFEALPLAVLFVLWSLLIVRDRPRISLLSVGVALGVALLSLAMIINGWKVALQYWGLGFTLAATAGNVAAIVTLGALVLHNRLRPSYRRNYTFHLVLFLWLAWCAVPWFAEGL